MTNPKHIAIIMDGNGRWGLKKYNSRLAGHKHGVENIKPIIELCIKKKIKILTIYAFSRDNLNNRKKNEILNLFSLFKEYLEKNIDYFKKRKIKLKFIGETRKLPTNITKIIKKTNVDFENMNYDLQLNVAFNYSSKVEIIESIKKIKKKNKSINEKNIEKYLYTSDCPNPEILIRTGGYSRLSDFLLWQCAYSEIFIEKKLWPDFKIKDFNKILLKFRNIKRNFGS